MNARYRSGSGTKLPIWDVLAAVATGGNAEMTKAAVSVVNDPGCVKTRES